MGKRKANPTRAATASVSLDTMLNALAYAGEQLGMCLAWEKPDDEIAEAEQEIADWKAAIREHVKRIKAAKRRA